ncbi:hypothetical protein BpHYR1_013294 [Brachionus plicatilis]|uniref:Uncharacterized protein n=1 Tax=Brachionus plicatilis TaxID=10195 RepID=A0A3M7RWF5_BRAPC|nr:hypothetical protein BpHYR1_013294 [Brachionus plicatilis]
MNKINFFYLYSRFITYNTFRESYQYLMKDDDFFLSMNYLLPLILEMITEKFQLKLEYFFKNLIASVDLLKSSLISSDYVVWRFYLYCLFIVFQICKNVINYFYLLQVLVLDQILKICKFLKNGIVNYLLGNGNLRAKNNKTDNFFNFYLSVLKKRITFQIK